MKKVRNVRMRKPEKCKILSCGRTSWYGIASVGRNPRLASNAHWRRTRKMKKMRMERGRGVVIETRITRE